ncbi:hypothetical protein [Actinomadura luteofluorescens]
MVIERQLLLARAHRQLDDHDRTREVLEPLLVSHGADLSPRLRGRLMLELGYVCAASGRPAIALFRRAATPWQRQAYRQKRLKPPNRPSPTKTRPPQPGHGSDVPRRSWTQSQPISTRRSSPPSRGRAQNR